MINSEKISLYFKVVRMDFIKNQKINDILNQARTVVFGQDEMLLSVIAAVICEGHILIEGMPGLGKTLTISTISKLMNLQFNRIQFTPDLLPSDLIGTQIFSQKNEEFETKFGPIFTSLLLADEINRSPAKVQSALLEAMAERQVTIGDQSYKLATPFVVMATQNPVEQEGTYQLPEAQLDRFMIKVTTEYPDKDAELAIISNVKKNDQLPQFTSWDKEQIKLMKEQVENIHIDEGLLKSIVRIIRMTRPGTDGFNESKYGKYIQHGASPRATIWLAKLARFNAFCCGRDYVVPDDILANIFPVLGHRVILTYEAKIDEINMKNLLLDIASKEI